MIWQGVISQPIQREKRQRHQKRLFLLLGIWFSINLLTINIYTLPFSAKTSGTFAQFGSVFLLLVLVPAVAALVALLWLLFPSIICIVQKKTMHPMSNRNH
ncbi:hypothetical protein LWI29_002692 [Acer saccharum]|uniref:Uncharacterized protein n=1 Tax=Acer saccharum TaxID=4024 RepID=A0AA39SS64_ACESA|nr:hypothetical protein LWI29_002692 [Acer saccharum]